MGAHWSFLSTHWVVGFSILPQKKRRRYSEVAQLIAVLSSNHHCGVAPALVVVWKWTLFSTGFSNKAGVLWFGYTMLRIFRKDSGDSNELI